MRAAVRRRTILAAFGLLVAFGCPAARLRGQQAVFGTEVFVTQDSDTLSGWTCGWSNFAFLGPDDEVTVLYETQPPFTAPQPPHPTQIPPAGYGQYGPIYAPGDGTYRIEPFWFAQTLGNLGGVVHPVTINPPGGLNLPPFLLPVTPYEEAHGVAPGHRQGLRFSRSDGRPFALLSLQYLGADTNFEIGTRLTTYNDFANYQIFAPPVLGGTAFLTLQLPPVPLNVRRLIPAPGTGAVVFDPMTGTCTATATVASFTRGDGTVISDPAVDPLIGGTLMVSGPYTGSDLFGLSDVAIAPATVTLTATGGDQLTVQGALFPGVAHGRLFGDPPLQPLTVQPLQAPALPVVSRSGNASAALDALELHIPLEPFLLSVALAPGGPALASVDIGYTPPAPGVTERTVVTSGSGDLAMAMANMLPQTVFYNFVQANPSGSRGSGSFFGIDFGPAQFQQLLLPLGSHPIHAQAGAAGDYVWSAPPGTVPPGFVLDVVLIELRPGGPFGHPVERLVF